MSKTVLNKLCLYSSMLNKPIKLLNKLKITRYFCNQLKHTNIISDPKAFKFTDYDCIGFDLDNTICRYKVGPMIKMEYEALSTYLVEKKNYPGNHLLKPLEDNVDFLLKGLILDFHNGNVLKINTDGTIIHASHGTRYLTKEEIMNSYGDRCHWMVTDIFTKDLLSTWNGPLSEQMRTLLDYFDIPTGLAFARIVDTLDEIYGKRQEKYNIWPDILAGLIDMYDTKQFGSNSGGYFPNIKANPESYIHKCDPSVVQWLKEMKSKNKTLFLITGSHVDFASLTSTTSMGENWKDLFDLVIFYAKKPGFFTDNRPFTEINPDTFETGKAPVKILKPGGWYMQGNWPELNQFLCETTKKPNPKTVYIGDNLIQDIYTPAVYTPCDTVAVVEELQAEGAFGFPSVHDFEKFLVSHQWGSFFECPQTETDNLWLSIIRQYSKLCVPTIDYITSKPIDHEYKL